MCPIHIVQKSAKNSHLPCLITKDHHSDDANWHFATAFVDSNLMKIWYRPFYCCDHREFSIFCPFFHTFSNMDHYRPSPKRPRIEGREEGGR